MDDFKTVSYLPPEKLASAFTNQAIKKVGMPFKQFFVFAILGGAFIAIGALFSLIIAGGVPQINEQAPGLTRLLAGLSFPLGLVLVVVAGAGLFTSDCATLPFAYWQKEISLKQVFSISATGYLANFIGAFIVAYTFAYQSETITKEPWLGYAKHIAEQKSNYNFFVVFLKGIGANIMVCLAVWMAASAKDIIGKVILIWLPVTAFVAMGWEHSIANMFYIPLGIMLGADVSINQFLINNLLPATIGNIIGGCVFVALPYYYLFGEDKNSYKTKSAKQNITQPESEKEKIHYEILQSINQYQHGSNN